MHVGICPTSIAQPWSAFARIAQRVHLFVYLLVFFAALSLRRDGW
jgi:hypothetical protein